MDSAKTLIRTAARTFFGKNAKQVLIIDALMLHSVLHIDDLAVLLASQPKDIRSLLNPLRAARLLATHSRTEARAGSNRGVQRDYYYCPFHPAIDAIKYRIAKLRRKVESLYQQDESKRKDWLCPRCKSEYGELEILDKIGEEGFVCDKCGYTLVQNEAAAKERGNHEKIRKLNIQLAKFDQMIAHIDRVEVPENDFLSAFERKKEVPRKDGLQDRSSQYVELKRENKQVRGPELVDTKNLAINLTSGAQREREEAEAREERKRKLAQQNLLPIWHTNSAIAPGAAGFKIEDGNNLLKKEEGEEKKPELTTMQDEVAAYMAEMERERIEAERIAKEESDEDDEFEDVVGTSAAGTPVPGKSNGIKREYDGDSGPSSGAGTPASMAERNSKRVKFENGDMKQEDTNGVIPKVEADSDEDEDFEDAL